MTIADLILAPVTPRQEAEIAEYVRNVSRDWKCVDDVFSLDGQLYADVSDMDGLIQDGRTYRWTITERQIGGADVETASLREVEWQHGTYEETGESL